MITDEFFERAGKFAAQIFGGEELPIIKVGTVAQGKTGEKIVAIQFRRARQCRHAIVANIRCRVLVRFTFGERAFEFDDIDAQIGLRIECQRFPVDVERVVAERGIERGECPAKRGARVGLIVFGIQ